MFSFLVLFWLSYTEFNINIEALAENMHYYSAA